MYSKRQMNRRDDVGPSCTNFKIQLIMIRVDVCPESRHKWPDSLNSRLVLIWALHNGL